MNMPILPYRAEPLPTVDFFPPTCLGAAFGRVLAFFLGGGPIVPFFVASVSSTCLRADSGRVLALALGIWQIVPFFVASVSSTFSEQISPRFSLRFRDLAA